MSKPRALTLCCCLAALPLTGCANGVGIGPQSQAPAPPALPAAYAAYPGGAGVYAARPGAPAAILVMMPGPGNFLAADPSLWAAQGFDVATPSPSEMYRIAADQETAVTRLIAQAQAMANAPVWLIGPSPAIEAAMAPLPPAGAGQVSGVVVTSISSGVGTCSERMAYSYSGSYSGNGAPKVMVSKSGDACPTGSPFGGPPNSTIAPAAPAAQPRAPRVIEASASRSSAQPSSQRSAVHRVADLIKASPSS